MKKNLLAIVLGIAMVGTCLVGCNNTDEKGIISVEQSNKAPVNTEYLETEGEILREDANVVFTLDFNPGVRFYVSEDNTILELEATNEDGEAIVEELDAEGENFEDIVEDVIDEMDEQGYIADDDNSILVSVEKSNEDISEKVYDRINKAFEKHGKRISVIEQEIDDLDVQRDEELEKKAKKYKISKGKACMIEKICEEFPELSEEEMANLNVNDLGVMLEETSKETKDHFKKIEEAIKEGYIAKEVATETALASLEITADDVTMIKTRFSHWKGQMVYKIKLVHDVMEYKLVIDALSGEILSTESEEYVEEEQVKPEKGEKPAKPEKPVDDEETADQEDATESDEIVEDETVTEEVDGEKPVKPEKGEKRAKPEKPEAGEEITDSEEIVEDEEIVEEETADEKPVKPEKPAKPEMGEKPAKPGKPVVDEETADQEDAAESDETVEE